MRMQTQFKVLGMKSSKGTMDGGQAFDSTKVYVETSLDDSKGTAKGFAVAEYTLGTSEEFAKYKHLTFPFNATAEVEMVTNGKTQKMVVHSLMPSEMSKGAAPARAAGGA
ncbi:hypothetical protein EGT07_14840 [Herbaspirillum sp. HC18]|nr:hypothetical protein EGT07_14840 [Herbaspirillum sp. HC18]